MKKLLCVLVSMFIFSAVFAQKYEYEVETGNLTGCKVENTNLGFSGKGYVKFSSIAQGRVELSVQIKKENTYAMEIAYSLADADQNAAVKVECDGLYVVTQKLPSSTDFKKVLINNTLNLKKGEHTIKISGYKGNWNLDSFRLIEATEEVVKQITPAELVNKNASAQAKNLYNYLGQIRGKGILSGQQLYGSNTIEIKTIQNATGKTPAVLGIDLIDYSPSRVAHGTSGGRTVYTAKKWWEEGGIVTCAWHWNAPMNLVDKDIPEMHWYDGFRTKATTFDFTKGLKDHESEEYKAMCNDIDAIAKPLKSLQAAGVPILWRPLHEASGTWFWWGSKGAANYIELYKFMFDKLVNEYKLDNLIWVWNGQDPAWYPGDEYVDIISYDYYPTKYQHGTANEYLSKIQSATTKPKYCAISENGALPNIAKLEAEKSAWLWWCTWNGDFTVTSDGRSYSEAYTKLDTLKLYYDNPYTITRDEIPSLK